MQYTSYPEAFHDEQALLTLELREVLYERILDTRPNTHAGRARDAAQWVVDTLPVSVLEGLLCALIRQDNGEEEGTAPGVPSRTPDQGGNSSGVRPLETLLKLPESELTPEEDVRVLEHWLN